MKQVLFNPSNGQIETADVPIPTVQSDHVLIHSTLSLISSGTERMLVDFGKSSLLNKAKQQPEKVRQAINKIKTDGLITTIEAIRNKLSYPMSMGYCTVGTVIEVGRNVKEFSVGDRVVSNGNHAEIVLASKNLCAKIPDNVSDENASFTVMGSIALESIRLLQPTLGETFAVFGLGLIGLLTIQLLKANGCKVIGLDFNPSRISLAQTFGIETVNLSDETEPLSKVLNITKGIGIDGAIIATATKSNDPIHQAAAMCRKRGRIVLSGTAGLTLSRSSLYEKELNLFVSCSYGPGRYDPNYEQKGQDYPIGYVRWTAQRNFEAVLDIMSVGKLETNLLVSHHLPITKASDAYELLMEDTSSLGILLKYPHSEKENKDHSERLFSFPRTIVINNKNTKNESSNSFASVGVIGCGNFSTTMLIPALKKTGATLITAVSNKGISSTYVARKFGFHETSTDIQSVMDNPDINSVIIATQHDSHANLVCDALLAKKNVFVEKPLAINSEQLDRITKIYNNLVANGDNKILMVGFNRRFSPLTKIMKKLIKPMEDPKCIIMTINSGQIPLDHWTQDNKTGGGRIIGEACHFIDLLRYLIDKPIQSIQSSKAKDNGILSSDDKLTITLSFTDGSIGTIHYFSNGHKSFPKERIEIFVRDKILQLDNFIKLKGFGWHNFKQKRLFKQDKGHSSCIGSFIEAVNSSSPSPIPFQELSEVTQASFLIAETKNNFTSFETSTMLTKSVDI
jgi:predicted dehydrogenase/threonine dehydrogenase-like Zn-dependent dehydrogenase